MSVGDKEYTKGLESRHQQSKQTAGAATASRFEGLRSRLPQRETNHKVNRYVRFKSTQLKEKRQPLRKVLTPYIAGTPALKKTPKKFKAKPVKNLILYQVKELFSSI
jgi:hypothetical protein